MTGTNPGVEIGRAVRTRGALGPRVVADVTFDGESRPLHYETSASDISPLMDPFLAAALAPAMKIGGPLVVHGPVSPDLLAHTEAIQRIFEIWRDDPRCPDQSRTRFRRIEVIADEVIDPPEGTGSAMFFSGGIDSFDTLLREQESLDALMFIDDFEMTFEQPLQEALFANVRAVADEFGLDAVRVRSNCRPLFSRTIGRLMHTGSELCSIGLLHAPRFARVMISSSDDLSCLIPLGTHPLLDVLYSTGGLTIDHDTLERTRMDKVLTVAQSDFALAHLRVCWGTTFNCGTCNKCVRTLLAIKAVDRLDAATSFERRDLTPAQVAAECTVFEYSGFYFEEIADHCEIAGILPEYVSAIRAALAPRPPEPISAAHALSVLAPEPARRAWRRLSRRRLPRE